MAHNLLACLGLGSAFSIYYELTYAADEYHLSRVCWFGGARSLPSVPPTTFERNTPAMGWLELKLDCQLLFTTNYPLDLEHCIG
jgi:hypothetical protein